MLVDLGSKNGTYVNKEKVSGSRKLWSGDRIELGLGRTRLLFKEWGTTFTLTPEEMERLEEDLTVDEKEREVYIGGTTLTPPLTRKEFDLLALLCRRRGEAVSKDEIAAGVWTERREGDVADYEIEQCVRRLRVRIEADPSQPQRVLTIRGYGYKMA